MKELDRTGGYINKLEVVQIHVGNNDFIAKEDIKKDDTVLFVPLEMLMTEEKAKAQSEYYKLLIERGFEMEVPHLASILFLMEERRKPDSYW